MDTASLEFLSPFLDGIDKWTEIATILPILVILELILSADNAVALASITKNLTNTQDQKQALNIGIAISLILRIVLILGANIIIKYLFVQVLAALYLLYIVVNKFIIEEILKQNDNESPLANNSISFIRVVALICITDLAFSLDSVTAAVAISDQILLVILGAFIGVIALRFTANLFIKWLDIYTYLESAGYIAIALVAVKLLLEVFLLTVIIPEYVFFILLVFVFIWGFSVKKVIK